MDSLSFKAVIFDLDGVVTKTARVHTRSWKRAFDEYMKALAERNNQPFNEFSDNDYLKYVDGKPRYEGVKSFLQSRGIELPYGDPLDDPDKETICGIGNKKNANFVDVLNEEGIEVYTSTVEFIKLLKSRGIKIGVASSSKNCRFILQAARIEALFETRVDGVVSAEIGLKGKPEPDIFITAAENLGVLPADAVVVEDAESGVAAGRNGAFGLVIGIARHKNEKELLEKGPDVVVCDLAQIDVEWIDKWFQKIPFSLNESWSGAHSVICTINNESIRSENLILNPRYFSPVKETLTPDKKVVFFLDYDGTLTPIVSRPELAVLSDGARQTLIALSKRYTTAIVSGRMKEDVKRLVGLDELIYAGSHGFDIQGPDVQMVEPRAQELIPVINKVAALFKAKLIAIKGVIVEEKKFSVAVHYRLVAHIQHEEVKQIVETVVKEYKQLRILAGKKVFEVMPAIAWNKGMAVRWIMDALKLSWEKHTIVYIGDDTTDEDAFRVVRGRGLAILVASNAKVSSAEFRLEVPEDVRKLFERLLS